MNGCGRPPAFPARPDILFHIARADTLHIQLSRTPSPALAGPEQLAGEQAGLGHAVAAARVAPTPLISERLLSRCEISTRLKWLARG